MSAVTVLQMTDRVSAVLEERMGIKGSSLADKLRKSGRRLPRKVRNALSLLSEAQEMAQNPKLLVRVDEARVADAYDICIRHLRPVSRGDRVKSGLLNIAASAAFALLLLAVLVIGFLYWRDLI